MNMRVVVVAATILTSSSLAAQTAAEHIAMGDREHAAMNASSALRHYQAAIEADANSVEALWRASREAIDLGEFDDAKRDSLYQLGEHYARRAVQADGKSSIAHFALAKAIGRRALSLGVKERVKLAGEVRQEALESLALDSTNAGALHVMGRWHANIMRLSGFSRFMAKNVLGGKTFGEASWKEAVATMQRASALEPDRIVHRLELAAIYADTGDKAKARQEYETVLRLKPMDFNDKHYQEQARKELAALK
jgi:tetratricopeptide (TPR) repeat protein